MLCFYNVVVFILTLNTIFSCQRVWRAHTADGWGAGWVATTAPPSSGHDRRKPGTVGGESVGTSGMVICPCHGPVKLQC